MLSASIFYGLICMFGYGILNIINGKSAKNIGAYRLAFLVQILGFFFTAFLFPVFSKGSIPIYTILSLSLLGLLDTAVYISFMKAFEKGSVSIVTPIVATWSLVTSVLSFIFLREKIITLKLIGIIITVIGVIVLSTDSHKLFKERKVRLILGAEWAGVTAIGWGINFFLISFFVKKLGWYLTNVGIRFWVFVSFLIITPFLKKNTFQLFKKIPKIIYLIAILDVFVYTLLNIGFEKGETSIVAVLTGAAPFISILLATIFLKEKLMMLQKIGIIFCLSGILLLSLNG